MGIMAGRVEGKVAFITGAARGQGRSYALRLAQERADIIAVDIAAQIGTVPYAMSTPEDLAETARQVETLDRRIVAAQADLRDFDAVRAALDTGVAQLGIVAANAGIFSFGTLEEFTEQSRRDMLDVNLTGVWHAVKAAIQHLSASGGGSIIITSSDAWLYAIPNIGHYVSAKHGAIGLIRTAALELAGDFIRVTTRSLPGKIDIPRPFAPPAPTASSPWCPPASRPGAPPNRPQRTSPTSRRPYGRPAGCSPPHEKQQTPATAASQAVTVRHTHTARTGNCLARLSAPCTISGSPAQSYFSAAPPSTAPASTSSSMPRSASDHGASAPAPPH
jgi:NAD(P)-dependent dehydrogenase (short-subunit alcohol dehydrogenase family)